MGGAARPGADVRFEVAKGIAKARSYGRCEGCGTAGNLDPHHRMTRGSGGVHGAAHGVSNDPRNLLMLCRICHDRTLASPGVQQCIADGWVIERRAGVDPREVPARIYTVNGLGWWFLTEDGGYVWAEEANDAPFYALTYKIQNDQEEST